MLIALLPLLILLAATLIVLIAIAIRRNHLVTAGITFAGLVAALIVTCLSATNSAQQVTPLLIDDPYSRFFIGLITATAAAVVVLAYSYFEKHPVHREEFYPLLLMATIGCSVLSASDHFVSLFLGLEVLSVSLYAMMAYLRDRKEPLEAGIKYLVLAAASAAFLLFGIALIYADTGDLGFAITGPIAPAAAVLLLVGIGFKLAVVPFHWWTPDVYEGAPAPVTAFVATASKAAVFAVLIRFFWMSSAHDSSAILTIVSIIAIASMFAGNLLALLQTNVKRILAYSSIAHLGYVLVAFVADRTTGLEVAAFYLAAYTVTTLGAFGVVAALSTGEGDAGALVVYQGLFWRRPVTAGILTAMMLSLAGIPATLGFLSKFYVLAAGADASAWALIIILVVTSVIGLFYYLRVVVALYSADTLQERPRIRIAPATSALLAVLVVLLIGFGIYPSPLASLTQAAARYAAQLDVSVNGR